MVEGARLEREYRATYLGFESLAVHHDSETLIKSPIIGTSSNTTDKTISNYDTPPKNYATSKRLYRVNKTYYYRRKVNKRLYRLSLRTKDLKVALYRRKLFNYLTEEEFVYTLKFGDYEYIFEYDTEEEFQKRRRDTIELHKELVELEAETLKYKKANQVLETLENKPTQTNRIKWAELEGKFIAYKKEVSKKQVSQSSYKAWASVFNKLKEFFNTTPIEQIELEDYEDFVNTLIEEYELKNKSVNGHIKYTNNFLDWAVSRKLIKENNITGIEKLPEEEYIRENYTNKEILEILKYDFPQEFKDIFSIAVYTGMRVSEICNLKQEDIIKDNETDIYYLDIKKSKSKNGKRKIPIHKNILNRVLEINFPLLNDKSTMGAKQKVILRQLYNIVDKNSTKNFHTFRGTFIAKAMNLFPDKILILQEIVGHSKNKETELTTGTYGLEFDLKLKKELIDSVSY